MSVLSQFPPIVIDRSISAPDYVKDVVDGNNSIDKRCIYQLMSNVRLSGLNLFDSQILMNSCTQKHSVNLDKLSQKNMSKENRKHGVIDQVNIGKDIVK